ncbi:MAG: hypothetical protein KAT53_01365 [Dehalococcoidia bacterium]|nr:hypothetical protein [Dehalococcoidia bacterium]
MEITLGNIENGYRITIKHSEDDIDHLDLPKNANCHNVIDAMYRTSERQLKHCLSEITDIIEILEAGSHTDFYNKMYADAHSKLNELVVYIAGQLNPKEIEANK